MKRLWKYFDGYRAVSIIGPLSKLLEAILELLVPLIVARIIDVAIVNHDQSLLIRYVAMMLGLALLGLGFAILAQFYAAKAATGITRNLTEDLFDRVLKLTKTTRDEFGPSGLITRLSSDTFQIQSGLNSFFRLLLRSPFIVFGALVMAIHIHPTISLYFVGMIVILFVIVFSILRVSTPLFDHLRVIFEELVTKTREQMQGMRVVRAFNQQDREIGEFRQTNRYLVKQQLHAGRIGALNNPLTYVTVNIILVAMMWQGGQLVSVGGLTQGQLVALINYLLSILVELVKLANIVTVMNKSYTSAKRVVSILEQPIEDLADTPVQLEQDAIVHSAMALDNVTFTYPGGQAPALNHINLAIKQGSFVGIIGSTGSGKSTLLSLLTKVYEPTSGSIYYNPDLFNTHSLEGLRESISIVPGQVSLFQGTVRSNLQIGLPDATDEQMWQALEDAQAKEFVSKLPEGLDSPVVAFGRNFSGGQRQRLTIARALIKPSPLLIFDDSTSALDYVTESNFQHRLREQYHDRTIIMISQRVHSLRHADLIVVLEAGEQVGVGTHEELMATSPVYQEIYASQAVKEVE